VSTTEQELWQMVMARYPKLENERKCALERNLRNAARQSYLQKLINERAREASILERGGGDAAQD
jgi:hypothetical protein